MIIQIRKILKYLKVSNLQIVLQVVLYDIKFKKHLSLVQGLYLKTFFTKTSIIFKIECR